MTSTPNPNTPSPPRNADPAEAAERLDRGEVILCVTETVHGIAASAADPDAVQRLRAAAAAIAAIQNDNNAAQNNTTAPPLAWHAPGAASVRAALDAADAAPTDAAWRRFDALAPGPVTAAIELDPEATERIAAVLQTTPGLVTRGNRLLVRIPDHPVARAVLERTSAPIVMAAAVPQNHNNAHDALQAINAALRDADATGLVTANCDGPPTPLGKPSTHLDIERNGAWTLTIEGAMPENEIRKRLTTNILFVCTGNTCRSPMAEGIAAALISTRPMPGVGDITVASAGVAATEGNPATPEAAAAARTVGANINQHSSKPLTRQLADNADVIFVLTKGHLDALRSLGHEAERKAQLLDPEGNDIPDPIGLPQDIYNQTARTLNAIIARRLEDAGVIEPDTSNTEP